MSSQNAEDILREANKELERERFDKAVKDKIRELKGDSSLLKRIKKVLFPFKITIKKV